MLRTLAILFFLVFPSVLRTTDLPEAELTLENVPDPGVNTANEPLAKAFSMESAARFPDAASLHWTKNRQRISLSTGTISKHCILAISEKCQKNNFFRSLPDGTRRVPDTF